MGKRTMWPTPIRLTSIWLTLVILGTACQPSPTQTQTPIATPPPYRLGFSGPLSGPDSYYGAAAKEGAELAIAEINQAGGVRGTVLEIVYADDQNNTAEAQTVLLQLANTYKIPILIGINSSSVTLATCKKAEELQIVQYSIGSSPKIGPACGSFTFQLQGNDQEQGAALVNIAQSLKAPAAAVVYLNNDYGVGNKTSFAASALAAGLNVLDEIPLMPEGTDYATEVAQLQSLKPPLVALIAYGREGAVFLRQAKAAGVTAQFVGDTNWGDTSAWTLAGDNLAGLIALQAGAHTSPEFQTFATAYQARYNKPPAIWAEYFYDEVRLAAQAIEAGGYTGLGIRDATLRLSPNWVGASGPKRLDAEHYVRWSFDWVQWTADGKLHLLTK
jgi:branched-chain amino acid transport system substrate-binding protein